MRKQEPKMSSWKKKGFGIFVIGETALFFGAWYCYHKMNTSIDWRFYMLNNHKWALDAYYYIGEKGGYKTKDQDYIIWGITDKSS